MPNIRLRRGTAAEWTAADPILLLGEVGLEIDTDRMKWGDGVSLWSALDYNDDIAIFNADQLQGNNIENVVPANNEVLTYITAASRWEPRPVAGGGGGLTITRQTSAYAAVNGDLVVCDTATTGSFTVTLPALPADNDTIGIYYEDSSGNRTVTIARNGNTIGSKAQDMVLYVGADASLSIDKGDYVEIQFDDSTNDWHVITDSRHPHRAKMRRAAAQSISNLAQTQIDFDTTDFDIGQIADSAVGFDFTIRRTGIYHVTANIGFFDLLDSTEFLIVYILIDGVLQLQNVNRSPGANAGIGVGLDTHFALSAGNVIRVDVLHNEGGSVSTSTTLQQQPNFSIQEVL